MSYAIISLGGKQYRVSEGQRLLVDRLDVEEGKTITPDVLLVGGTGTPALAPSDVTVTVKVVGEQRGPEDPHRKVQEAHRLQAPHRLPRRAHADRGRVDRRQEARRREAARGGQEDGGRGGAGDAEGG